MKKMKKNTLWFVGCDVMKGVVQMAGNLDEKAVKEVGGDNEKYENRCQWDRNQSNG